MSVAPLHSGQRTIPGSASFCERLGQPPRDYAQEDATDRTEAPNTLSYLPQNAPLISRWRLRLISLRTLI